jgi:hypothetical protein
MASKQISTTMYKSLEHKFKSELLSAKSSILVYFHNSVGIGEHPQHLEEIDKLIDTMASSKDKLDILQNHFSKYDSSGDHEESVRRASP